jgi:choline kinase
LTFSSKLLLRIYGPNIEKLIDRDNEMRTLERLARKGIGPCLLGTFSNGRFEEFLHARPLTAEEIRIPETSKQIAKRIRELHSGIDLLQEEREAGPSIWQKWDNLVDHCEQVVTWLDRQILEDKQVTSPSPSPLDDWRKRGFVCGTKWPTFRRVIESYRTWLEEQYGGADKINEQLVFAHNDVSVIFQCFF